MCKIFRYISTSVVSSILHSWTCYVVLDTIFQNTTVEGHLKTWKKSWYILFIFFGSVKKYCYWILILIRCRKCTNLLLIMFILYPNMHLIKYKYLFPFPSKKWVWMHTELLNWLPSFPLEMHIRFNISDCGMYGNFARRGS